MEAKQITALSFGLFALAGVAFALIKLAALVQHLQAT